MQNIEQNWPEPPSRHAVAWGDMVSSAKKYWIWSTLALQDIKLRYRGSVLGPFWLTVTTIVMVSSMGVIYSTLFHMEMRSYLPYLALGLITWGFVSGVIVEGCGTFTSAEGVIQTVPMPFCVHAYRTACRSLIVFAHNIVIVPIGLVLFQIPLTWRLVEVIPALALYAINGVWICILFGMLSARFRDIPPIVANFTQVLFFVTPIMYPAGTLGRYNFIVDLNPAFAAIDVVRAPLLGLQTSHYSWPMLIGITIIGSVGTFILFARFRSRIAYWI